MIYLVLLLWVIVCCIAIWLGEHFKKYVWYGHFYKANPSAQHTAIVVPIQNVVKPEQAVSVEVIQSEPIVHDIFEYDYRGWVAQNFVYKRTLPEWFIDKWVATLTISAAEQLIIDQLNKYDIWWEREVSFREMPLTEKGANYRYDFLLPHHNIVIEYHGKNWHQDIEKVAGDKLKEQFCSLHNIEYITYDSKHYYHMSNEIEKLMNRLKVPMK